MLVNAYPNAYFQWAEGYPCYMDRKLVVYPWAKDYNRLCQSAATYWVVTDPWRSLGKPKDGETTADLLQRSQCLIELAPAIPELSLRPVIWDNFRDNVFMGFQAETQAYLRRFFVRCDHLQGLTVDDLRKHFEHVFRVKRGNAASEDESDHITVTENLYQRILVHLVYYL